MNVPEQSTQKQGKKIIKKYILHQKVNPRLLGVELSNKHVVTSHEAYLSCKLIFRKDIHSLMELEQIAQKIDAAWTEKKDELLIKRINVFMSPVYIVLTFTIGFHEEAQIKRLRELKEFAKEIIETYENRVKQETEAKYKRKEEGIYDALEKFSQLTKKMEGLEDRLEKNESIVLDSGELLKNELTKVSQTIKEQMNQAEYIMKKISRHPEKKESVTEKRKASIVNPSYIKKKVVSAEKTRVRKYILDRTKQLPVIFWKKNSVPIQLLQKNVTKRKQIPAKKKGLKSCVSQLELDILTCFTTNEDLNKKRMVPRKQLLTLKGKVEFIDYLWMLLELEGKEEIIIAGKLSCRELIEELGQFMEIVEKVVKGPTIFSYWVYCSQEMLVKLEGYAALKDFFSNSLRLNTNTLVNEA